MKKDAKDKKPRKRVHAAKKKPAPMVTRSKVVKNADERFNLSKKQQKFIKNLATEDDPGLLIVWDDDLVEAALLNATGGQIANLPPAPAFLNTTSPTMLKDSIHTHLRTVSGGSLGNFIAPNTGNQYDNVLTLLAYIEIDPYVQALGSSVGNPLAMCGRVNDGKAVAAVPCVRVAPPAPHVQVFA